MLSAKVPKKITVRLLLVCAVAISVGLSMALVSIGKLTLFVFGLAFLIHRYFVEPFQKTGGISAAPHHTARAVLAALIAFGVSLLWTSADAADSAGSIAKYGKLLTILLLPLLLKNRYEVICAISAFAAAQLFLVGSSWLLFLGISLPWATSYMAKTEFAVFSTYLDQSVMSATAAAVCWHLRYLAPGRFGKAIFIGISLLCISNILFLLHGRTGHVLAVVLLSLAVMWELPKKYRWTILVLPAVFLAIFAAVSPKVQQRALVMSGEIKAFSTSKETNFLNGSSSGLRLHFWQRSIQSIAESPVLGSGVGSWSNEYDRVEKHYNPTTGAKINKRANPHQEYLLWGVQLGVAGIVLFVGFLLAVFRDTLKIDTASARAAQSVLAALAVSCLFNSSIYDAHIGDFFCVALGLMLALAGHTPQPPRNTVVAAT